MLCGSECWAVNEKKIEQRMGVTEMRMLRWTGGMTREDRIGNEYVRESVGVASIVDKMGKTLTIVMRSEKIWEAVRTVIRVEGRRGRPKNERDRV